MYHQKGENYLQAIQSYWLAFFMLWMGTPSDATASVNQQ